MAGAPVRHPLTQHDGQPLANGYAEMAADVEREREALLWSEASLRDLDEATTDDEA